jgi:hypothetical protein
LVESANWRSIERHLLTTLLEPECNRRSGGGQLTDSKQTSTFSCASSRLFWERSFFYALLPPPNRPSRHHQNQPHQLKSQRLKKDIERDRDKDRVSKLEAENQELRQAKTKDDEAVKQKDAAEKPDEKPEPKVESPTHDPEEERESPGDTGYGRQNHTNGSMTATTDSPTE